MKLDKNILNTARTFDALKKQQKNNVSSFKKDTKFTLSKLSKIVEKKTNQNNSKKIINK